jgi:hypothetical protein
VGTDRLAHVDEPLELFIRQMPKVELHLHLEGSIRPTTLRELARRHGIALPTTDVTGLARWYRFRDFPHFIEIYRAICSCLRDGADFAHIMRELGETAAAQRVRRVIASYMTGGSGAVVGEQPCVIGGTLDDRMSSDDARDPWRCVCSVAHLSY